MSRSVSLATREDDADLRQLLRETPMRGRVTICFEREPDYFLGENLHGAEDAAIVVREAGRLLSMGRCSRRDCWLDGEKRRVGYLAELRLAQSARGRVSVLRDGYRYFQTTQQHAPADFYFTSIAADNLRARRLLESGASALPQYALLGELNTVLIHVQVRSSAKNHDIKPMQPDHIPAVLRLLDEHGQRHHLQPVWSEEQLRSALGRLYVWETNSGIVACGGLWDQRSFRQTVIREYAAPLKWIRPLLNLAGKLCGRGQLPAVGETLAQMFLSPFVCHDSPAEFVAALMPYAASAGAEFVTLAVPIGTTWTRQLAGQTWRSRLYQVSWPGRPAREISGVFLPDVALL